ncbi:HNH endonuclease [Vibrio phage 2.275.O._10N.286.54.E11]|nr:HNH endonuclease [Vibrio phage 2.275.O._10N.286.54.E11]
MNKLIKAQKQAVHLHQHLKSILRNIKTRTTHLKNHITTPAVKRTLEMKIQNGYKQLDTIIAEMSKLGCLVKVDRKKLKVINYKAPSATKTPKEVIAIAIANGVNNKKEFSTVRLAELRLALNGDMTKQAIRSEMFAFMPNVCVKCGSGGNGQMMTADHIIPQSKNKSLIFQVLNLQPMCEPCNQSKAASEDADYRTPQMKFAALQRLLHRTGNIVPEHMCDRDINICTLRILQYTQIDIANKIGVSQGTVSKIVNTFIPYHNVHITEILRVKKQINKENI